MSCRTHYSNTTMLTPTRGLCPQAELVHVAKYRLRFAADRRTADGHCGPVRIQLATTDPAPRPAVAPACNASVASVVSEVASESMVSEVASATPEISRMEVASAAGLEPEPEQLTEVVVVPEPRLPGPEGQWARLCAEFKAEPTVGLTLRQFCRCAFC